MRFWIQSRHGNQTISLEYRHQGHNILEGFRNLDPGSLRQSARPHGTHTIPDLTFHVLLVPYSVFLHLHIFIYTQEEFHSIARRGRQAY